MTHRVSLGKQVCVSLRACESFRFGEIVMVVSFLRSALHQLDYRIVNYNAHPLIKLSSSVIAPLP